MAPPSEVRPKMLPHSSIKLLRLHALLLKLISLRKLRAINQWRRIISDQVNFSRVRQRMTSLAHELRQAAAEAQQMEQTISDLQQQPQESCSELRTKSPLQQRFEGCKNHGQPEANPCMGHDCGSSPVQEDEGEEEEEDVEEAEGEEEESFEVAELKAYIRANLAGFQDIFLKHCSVFVPLRLAERPRFEWIGQRNDYGKRAMVVEDWCSCVASLFISAELLPRKVAVQIFRHYAVLREGKLAVGLDQMISCFVYASQYVNREVDIMLSSKEMLVITLFKLYNSEQYFPAVLEDATAVDVSSSVRKEMSGGLHKGSQGSKRAKLRSIFEQYCRYGDRRNTGWMSSSKFCKMCRECGVIDKTSLRQQELEICFRSVLSEYIKEQGPNTKQMKRLPFDKVQTVMGIVGRRHYPRECKSTEQAYDRIQSIIIANFKTSSPLTHDDPFSPEVTGKRFSAPIIRSRA